MTGLSLPADRAASKKLFAINQRNPFLGLKTTFERAAAHNFFDDRPNRKDKKAAEYSERKKLDIWRQ
jgi:hypothetical protein